MKKIYYSLFLLTIVFSANSFAQSGKMETAVDTAGKDFNQDAQITFSAGGVPFVGTNPGYDKEFAQYYPYTGSTIHIEKILIKFWYKSGTGSINVNVYNTSTGGTPTTVNATKSLSLSNIDTSSTGSVFTVVTLTTPAAVSTDFAVGVDLSPIALAGAFPWTAGLGLMTTNVDEPHQSTNARIKIYQGSWVGITAWASHYGITGTGSGNANFMILPVLDGVYTPGSGSSNVNEMQEINGIKLTTYPNPTRDLARIEYQIKEDANVSLELIDATGKTILIQKEGKQTGGNHEIVLNVSQLPAGNYFYSLTAGDKRLTKQMTVK